MMAVRRKRDDDSTFQSNSQCSSSRGGDPSLANMDASQSSMVALDASTIATDSSVIRRRHKRRRTTIVDQLQQINISNGEVGVPNQILEQAVVDDNSQTLTSSSGSEEEDDEHEQIHNHNYHSGHSQNHNHSQHHSHRQILPPSDIELAQQAMMREFVFGKPPQSPPLDPVDRKLQTLVRKSLENIQTGYHPFELNQISASQDDMHIDPMYTRPSDPSFFDTFPTASAYPEGLVPALPHQLPLSQTRKRSNSLPEGLMEDLADATMELS